MIFFPCKSFDFKYFFLVLSLAFCAKVAHADQIKLSPLASASSVQAVANSLVGIMDTSAQAARQPTFPNVRMTTCPVVVTDRVASAGSHSSIFLYQEQALNQRLDQPYRQRFLQISPAFQGQAVRSLSFRPENPKIWVGLCDRNPSDRLVTTTQLGQPICSVILKPAGQDYVGQTPVDGCVANYRGATRITNRIRLHRDGMDTWDRGFDRAGQQIWGANEEAYEFRWINPQQR